MLTGWFVSTITSLRYLLAAVTRRVYMHVYLCMSLCDAGFYNNSTAVTGIAIKLHTHMGQFEHGNDMTNSVLDKLANPR